MHKNNNIIIVIAFRRGRSSVASCPARGQRCCCRCCGCPRREAGRDAAIRLAGLLLLTGLSWCLLSYRGCCGCCSRLLEQRHFDGARQVGIGLRGYRCKSGRRGRKRTWLGRANNCFKLNSSWQLNKDCQHGFN